MKFKRYNKTKEELINLKDNTINLLEKEKKAKEKKIISPNEFYFPPNPKYVKMKYKNNVYRLISH